jgi:hypothetical protein
MSSPQAYWSKRSADEIRAAAEAEFGSRPVTTNDYDREKTIRFGNKGSLVVNLAGRWAGRWKDFETEEKGWLTRPDGAHGVNGKAGGRESKKKSSDTDTPPEIDNKQEMDQGGQPARQNDPSSGDATDEERARAEAEAKAKAELEAKCSHVREQWDIATPVKDTPAETYLTEHRQLTGPFSAGSLRYNPGFRLTPASSPAPALVVLVTDPSTGEAVAHHAVYLDPETGTKATTLNEVTGERETRQKLSYGQVSAGFVCIGDPEAATVVVAEGLETGLSRLTVAPARLYVCCGSLREPPVAAHQRRVEFIADNDKVKRARQVARNTDRRHSRDRHDEGIKAVVVRVPHDLGPKADLNDLLCARGSQRVERALADAEIVRSASAKRADGSVLRIGSDVEIAQRCLESVEDIHGEIAHVDGQWWRFDGCIFKPFRASDLNLYIHGYDGESYPGADGEFKTVRLSSSRVSSIERAMTTYRDLPIFFIESSVGVSCSDVFLRWDTEAKDFVAEEHHRRFRQRHHLSGRWHYKDALKKLEQDSLVSRLMTGAFLGDDDIEQKILLVQEIAGAIAAAIGTRISQPKAHVWYGPAGNNAKSTIQDALRGLANPEAVSSIPPSKFGDEKYAYQLGGKVANIVDELGDRAIRSDAFKRAVTGEPIPARDLYKSAGEVRAVATNIFSTNTLPTFAGGIDGGVLRRLLPLEFNRVIPAEERIPLFGQLVAREEPDLLLHFALAGAKRLMERGRYTVPPSSEALLNSWVRDTDVVRGWVAARLIEDATGEVWLDEAYADSMGWCAERGIIDKYIPRYASFGNRLRTSAPELEFVKASRSKIVGVRLSTGPMRDSVG